MSNDDGDLLPLVLMTPDGPLWTTWAIALLTGASVAQVRATGARRTEDLPADLLRAARRRAGETAARTNTRDALTALRYWAGELFGVELIVKADGVWMPRPAVHGWAADG